MQGHTVKNLSNQSLRPVTAHLVRNESFCEELSLWSVANIETGWKAASDHYKKICCGSKVLMTIALPHEVKFFILQLVLEQ